MTDRFLLTPMSLDQPAPDLRRIRREGWSINEPDLVRDATVRRRIAAVNEPIARFTEEAVRAGDRPICITGDCCAAIGAVTGLQRAGVAPTLLWLDAHGDFNTPETTPSGFLGGMPLAMLTGRGDLEILDALGARAVDDDTVVLYDARDLDPLEREALAASRVTRLSSLEALDGFDFRGAPVHAHLDPDVLNPLDAPAMAYATPGGPRLAALSRALSRLTGRGVSISSVTVTTWAIDRDASGVTEAGGNAAARVVAGTSDSIGLRYARSLVGRVTSMVRLPSSVRPRGIVRFQGTWTCQLENLKRNGLRACRRP